MSQHLRALNLAPLSWAVPTAKCTYAADDDFSINCNANYQAEYHSESSLQLTLALKKTWIINPCNCAGFVDAWLKVPGREPEWSWHNPLKNFLPPFQTKKKSIKNYLIRVCYIRKLVSSHQKFDLILEMYWILPWKCWCICLLAGHDMGDPFEVSTVRREVIIYYLTIMYMLITYHIFFLLQETIILNMVNFYLSYPLLWQTSHLKY